MGIHRAARVGNLSAVQDAIRKGEDINSVDEGGYTPLWWAACGGHTDCARELLSSGATVDLANKYGGIPLSMAARKGHHHVVRELLSSGAAVDLADKYGVTPLMDAAYGGYLDTVKELLSSGASVHCTNKNGETALMMAKRSGYSNPGTIKLLMGTTESQSPPKSVWVLPQNWAVVTDTETKKPVYQNKTRTEDIRSTPPGYPLHQTSAHPDVTFYDKPQEKEFTSSGGYADFDNGVEVTVPANAVPAGTSVGIKVQPSLAPNDVFVMPKDIQSASPSYLISGEGLNGEVTLSIEHHV
ncbi:ankyrin repeat domain-containing protein 29-like isoform X2 [Halichondria panicea]|uniref:ankyrin repeat domain-containing protein 29-like isoform X2 n=1 Tax=Halichondria panicea TaxID=6063 RepID=UPI00312B8ED8